MISPCGLDCNTCQIYLAGKDPELARRLAGQFLAAGHPGDIANQRSTDSEIPTGCVDNDALDSYSKCGQSIFENVGNWAKSDPGYQAALVRLKQLKFA